MTPICGKADAVPCCSSNAPNHQDTIIWRGSWSALTHLEHGQIDPQVVGVEVLVARHVLKVPLVCGTTSEQQQQQYSNSSANNMWVFSGFSIE
jgi:hypothetical protein